MVLPERGTERALAAAARDLCPKKVALIGENGFHGDGRTMTFKAALVERLIHKCRFNAVFFEASHYDFIAISRAARRGAAVTDQMVSSAIGGIWNKDRALAPLVADLARGVNAHRLILGGLDDQLGGRDAFYSLEQMPSDLARFLPPSEASTCRDLLWQRIHFAIPKNADAHLHHQSVENCLSAIRNALTKAPHAPASDPADYIEMVDSTTRDIGRDGQPADQMIRGRDKSMFQDFQWLDRRLPKGSKIILWAENAHVANDDGRSEDYSGSRNLGAYIHQTYGSRAFSLGFTAAGGTFRWSARESRPIPPAPPGSLEARVSGEGDAVYVGPARLAAFGTISAGATDGHAQAVRAWRDFYDGLIVFRTEHPPARIDE